MIKNLIITAHPDDEILFCSRFLLNNASETRVITVTTPNKNRRIEFEDVMEYIGVRDYEMWRFEDDGEIQIRGGYELNHLDKDIKLKDKLKEIKEDRYKKIITHNENGDYSHIHHKYIHDVVTTELNEDKIYTFSKDKEPLSDGYLKVKQYIFNNFYKSQSGAILLNPDFDRYVNKEGLDKYIKTGKER